MIRAENPNLPEVIPGGAANNPMGAAALTMRGGEYAIHGTNRPASIGGFVSYGCIRMYNSDIQQLYREVEHGERFGRLALEQVYLIAINQIGSMYADPPEVRYSKFLSDFRDIVQRIPQYYIASYVGIKPQSLSRIRKRIAGKH